MYSEGTGGGGVTNSITLIRNIRTLARRRRSSRVAFACILQQITFVSCDARRARSFDFARNHEYASLRDGFDVRNTVFGANRVLQSREITQESAHESPVRGACFQGVTSAINIYVSYDFYAYVTRKHHNTREKKFKKL